jgi:hypothetical protein
MTATEKIAGTYLRLNGFLLLPHFTVFDGKMHGHVDFVALRAAHSEESVDGLRLLVDQNFFRTTSEVLALDAQLDSFGIVAEVRTNQNRENPSKEHIAYVRRFLGGLPLLPVSFADDGTAIRRHGDNLSIGLRYALAWILERIQWMHKQRMRLTKTGSWTWSEDFLSDILVLRHLTKQSNQPLSVQ